MPFEPVAQLGEAKRLARKGVDDRHRPLLETDLLEPAGTQEVDERPAARRDPVAPRGQDVLRTERVSVPGVAADEPAFDQGRQRAAQRLAIHPEHSRKRREPAAALAMQLGEDRHRPAVVEESYES